MADQTTTTTLTGDVAQDSFNNVLTNLNTLTSQGVDYFPTSTVAAPSAFTSSGTSALADSSGAQTNILNDANNAFAFTLGDMMNPESNAYLQAYAKNATQPIIDNLMQQILPGIGQSAVGAGGFGGTAHANLKENAINNALTTVGNTTDNIYSNAYGTNLNAYMQALGLTPTMLGVQSAPAQTLLQAGGITDAQNQAVLNDEVNRFNFNQTSDLDLYMQYLQALNSGPTTQTITANMDPSPADKLLNVASLGLL